MKKSKLILPLAGIATISAIAIPLVTLTSCNNNPTVDETDEIVKKYSEFYNNYKTGSLKDKIYRTAEIGSNVVCTWTNDGTAVTASQIVYDPVVEQLTIGDENLTNELQFNVSQSPEAFREILKAYQLASTSHKYTVNADDITFEFKNDSEVIYSITYNKNGYITHYKKEKVEATFVLQNPTSTRLLEVDKFLIAYDKLCKFFRSQTKVYVSNDVGDKLTGVLKITNTPDANLQDVAFYQQDNYQTGNFGGSYTNVAISMKDDYVNFAKKIKTLSGAGFTTFTYTYENWETNGISMKAENASSETYEYKWNKNGYLTYVKEIVDSATAEMTVTYTKDPTTDKQPPF